MCSIDGMSIEDQILYYQGKIKELRSQRVCSYCGKSSLYARGLCVNCYQRFVRNGTAAPKVRVPKEKAKIVKPKIPWREKLGVDVVESVFALPNDYDESVDFVLNNTLPERYRDFVLKRYRDGMTLRQTGATFNVTQERARQIISRSIRWLRNPYRVRYFTVGLAEISEQARKEEEAEKLELEEAVKQAEEKKQNALTEKEFRAVLGATVDIENLGLSVRTFNVLYRANIKTLADIDEIYGDDGERILKLRNCGRKTLNEVKKIVERFRAGVLDVDGFELHFDKESISVKKRKKIG